MSLLELNKSSKKPALAGLITSWLKVNMSNNKSLICFNSTKLRLRTFYGISKDCSFTERLRNLSIAGVLLVHSWFSVQGRLLIDFARTKMTPFGFLVSLLKLI